MLRIMILIALLPLVALGGNEREERLGPEEGVTTQWSCGEVAILQSGLVHVRLRNTDEKGIPVQTKSFVTCIDLDDYAIVFDEIGYEFVSREQDLEEYEEAGYGWVTYSLRQPCALEGPLSVLDIGSGKTFRTQGAFELTEYKHGFDLIKKSNSNAAEKAREPEKPFELSVLIVDDSHHISQVVKEEGGSECSAEPCGSTDETCDQTCPKNKACISYCDGNVPVCECIAPPKDKDSTHLLHMVGYW